MSIPFSPIKYLQHACKYIEKLDIITAWSTGKSRSISRASRPHWVSALTKPTFSPFHHWFWKLSREIPPRASPGSYLIFSPCSPTTFFHINLGTLKLSGTTTLNLLRFNSPNYLRSEANCIRNERHTFRNTAPGRRTSTKVHTSSAYELSSTRDTRLEPQTGPRLPCPLHPNHQQ